MFTYSAFVEALAPLIKQASTLLQSADLADGADFRRWRHDLADLIQRIESRSYRVNCDVAGRAFRIVSLGGPVSKEGQRARFRRDMEDTIAELEILVALYDQFGDPNPPQTLPTSVGKPLAPPDKVTLAWLWQHAPISLWAAAASALAVAFALGVGAGQSRLYVELEAKLRPAAASAPKP